MDWKLGSSRKLENFVGRDYIRWMVIKSLKENEDSKNYKRNY